MYSAQILVDIIMTESEISNQMSNLSIEDIIEQIRSLIASQPEEIEVIPPDRFCKASTFFDGLPEETLKQILKLEQSPSPYRAEYCSRLSQDELLGSLRSGTGRALKLRKSIIFGALAVYHMCKDLPERGIVISMFGRALREKWKLTKDDQDLEDTIYYFRKAVDIGPPGANRALHIDDLGCALSEKYTKRHEETDFVEARQNFLDAIAMSHPEEPLFHHNLGAMVMEKTIFRATTDPHDFDECINIYLKGLKVVTSDFRGSLGPLHWRLGTAYRKRYNLSVLPDDWAKAKDSLEAAIPCAQRGAPNRVIYLIACGELYSSHFSDFGHLEDGDRSIELYREALVERPDNSYAMAALGETLRVRADYLSSSHYLVEALQLLEQSVSLTPADDDELPFRMGRQAQAYAQRSEIAGNIADMDKSIAILESILEIPGLGDHKRWKYLETLTSHLVIRFRATENTDDLTKSTSAIREALSTEGLTNEEKSLCLRQYGNVLSTQFKFDGQEENLRKALEVYKSTIALAGPDYPQAYLNYNDRGHALLLKFERTGAIEDITAAIESYHEAIASVHRHSTPETRGGKEATLLHGLGNAQYCKFQRWGRVSDIDLAINSYQRAFSETESASPRLAGRVGSLSWALQIRFDATKAPSDLQKARKLIEDFLALPIQVRPADSAYLENRLGAIFLRSYLSEGGMDNLDLAIKHFRKVKDMKVLEPALTYCGSSNLALTLLRKAEATKQDPDFIAALSQYTVVLKELKQNDSYRGNLCMNLAHCFYALYQVKKQVDQANAVISAYDMCLSLPATPEIIINGNYLCGKLEYEANHNPIAARDRLIKAVNELPEALLLCFNRSEQLRLLKQFTPLSSHIAAFSLECGDSAKDALRSFERCRGIIWDRLLNDKADIGDLETQHPDLATAYKQLRERLAQNPPTRASDPLHTSSLTQLNFHQAALAYNANLDEIRKQPGFENFLLLPDEPLGLTQYASDGPVVIFNGNEVKSNAFIIRTDGITSLPLPLFVVEEARRKAIELAEALSSMTHDVEPASSLTDGVLQWLWRVAAEPILRELGFVEGVNGERFDQPIPHVWWITTGWISIFPIHAAGDHSRACETGEACTVLDRVISSYVPTLRAMGYARSRSRSTASRDKTRECLMVQMPTTDDNAPLPNAATEVSRVRSVVEAAGFHAETLDCPKRAEVLNQLKSCTIAHFACHASANTDPSLSKLLLQDWYSHPLDVRSLLRTKVENCQLVYLSGCQTAASGLLDLQEEGIHLSGAFQMAGVPQTVATLWRIEDQLSVEISERFYEGLKCEGGRLDVARSAESLRSAILKVRENGVHTLLWAAYAHYGA